MSNKTMVHHSWLFVSSTLVGPQTKKVFKMISPILLYTVIITGTWFLRLKINKLLSYRAQ